MNKIVLIAFALAFTVNSRAAETELLTPEPARITDEAIAADMKVMQGVQKKLEELNKKGVPIASYHFAKAQAWLDFALDAYTMNDRSHVVEEALRQAVDIIRQLEAGKKDIAMSTPIIPTSALVRTDLWDKAEKLKKHPNFRCAEDKVAQLEVQLVWAGHEEKEFGWRHSKPYLQAAERLAREAGAQSAKCPPLPGNADTLPAQPCSDTGTVASGEGTAASPPWKQAMLCPPCGESLPASILKSIEPLPDRIHFALDSANISAASTRVLDRVVAAMKHDATLRIYLHGHADQRGSVSHNLDLSRQRAESVRARLISAGVAADRISLATFGKAKPLTDEKSVDAYARNRRVEFLFTIGKSLPVAPQQEDLQPEKVK
jgi:outer membrane protein OmpA-like peptidoglycan-associated protein